jgi:hypothetical protein
MMRRGQKAIKALALVLVFSVLHLFPGTALTAMGAQAGTGKLTTRGNQPITVNGILTNSGATILTGAAIETGDQIGATINLGTLGSLDIAPNTKLQLTFNNNGTIQVTLLEGCVILHVKEGTFVAINTPEGRVVSNDETRKESATLDVCLPKGAPAAIINQGAAANAGAGAGAVGGTVASQGLSAGVVGGLIAGGAGLGILALIIANRGEDPSNDGS